MTDFDVVYMKAGKSNSNSHRTVCHVRTDCQYYKVSDSMIERSAQSLWDSTQLCKECQRLLESE
jgi:hypothetical protein